MIKCYEFSTGKEIGTIYSIPDKDYEHIYEDYTYEFKSIYEKSNIAFFAKKNFNSTIENNFKYHSPKEGQPEIYEAIRSKAKELAVLIDEMVPNSREKSTALTNLEQSVFWANAGIARN